MEKLQKKIEEESEGALKVQLQDTLCPEAKSLKQFLVDAEATGVLTTTLAVHLTRLVQMLIQLIRPTGMRCLMRLSLEPRGPSQIPSLWGLITSTTLCEPRHGDYKVDHSS